MKVLKNLSLKHWKCKDSQFLLKVFLFLQKRKGLMLFQNTLKFLVSVKNLNENIDFHKLFKKDTTGLKQLKNIEDLVNAIEYYHCGKWESSINCYLKFLVKNHEVNT